MSSVVVVGSVNVDIMARVESLPAPGQTLLGTESVIRPGGKGANQAVAAARLGAPTRMIAAVGDDDFGTRMTANLAEARKGAPKSLRVIPVKSFADAIAQLDKLPPISTK